MTLGELRDAAAEFIKSDSPASSKTWTSKNGDSEITYKGLEALAHAHGIFNVASMVIDYIEDENNA